MIYASYMDQHKIVKIDGKTNTIINMIGIGGGDSTELIPQDIVSNPTSHTLYVSTKYANNVFVIGPNAVSTTVPIIAKDTPAATVIGVIRAHGKDVQVSDSLADIKTKSIRMKLISPDGGELALRIPRTILDAKDSKGNDEMFKVLINRNPI